VLALRFPDVPAVIRRREFGAHALPARARVEDDLMVIDEIFASRDGSGFHDSMPATTGLSLRE